MPSCQEPGDLEDLRETVKPYHRHALVCVGDLDLGPRVENMDSLVGSMAQEAKDLRDELDEPFKVTALRTPPSGDGYDVVVFPERVVYRDVGEAEWASIRDGHLRTGDPVEKLDPEPVSGSHVLVCTHTERDERCGDCGPLVIEAFREAIQDRGLAGDVLVHPCSHVGGHRYAGNVLVYPGGAWYGYVRPGDVGTILDKHEDGEVWEEHFRGQMEG